jgi:hypothetical protein
MKSARSIFTVILASLTLLALVLSTPASLRDAYDRDGFYLFSQSFIEDIPKRLVGPGRFQFILQPSVLLDSLFQWMILGGSYPGAALVVGPMLIVAPLTPGLARWQTAWPVCKTAIDLQHGLPTQL